MPNKKGFLARAPFPVTFTQSVAAGSLLTTNALFTNPLSLGEYYEVLGVDAALDVVSTSGTADLRRVPVSTAFTGGDRILSTTIDLGVTARSSRKIALASTALARLIRPGDTVSLIFAGTMTNLVGLTLVLWLQAVRGKRGR